MQTHSQTLGDAGGILQKRQIKYNRNQRRSQTHQKKHTKSSNLGSLGLSESEHQPRGLQGINLSSKTKHLAMFPGCAKRPRLGVASQYQAEESETAPLRTVRIPIKRPRYTTVAYAECLD